jgi:hypothetical protein
MCSPAGSNSLSSGFLDRCPGPRRLVLEPRAQDPGWRYRDCAPYAPTRNRRRRRAELLAALGAATLAYPPSWSEA